MESAAISAHTAVPDTPVHLLIAEQAARTPQRVAVECGGSGMSYAELVARAATVTARLRATGVRRGDLVAVAVPRGVDLVAALLGVLGAGAAYVPLDADHPADRLSYILDDAA